MRNSRSVCFLNVLLFILIYPGISLLYSGHIFQGSCLLIVLVAVSVRVSLYTPLAVDPAHANRVRGQVDGDT